MSNNFKSVFFLFFSNFNLIFILQFDVGAHCFTFVLQLFSTEYFIIAV